MLVLFVKLHPKKQKSNSFHQNSSLELIILASTKLGEFCEFQVNCKIALFWRPRNL